MPSNIYTTEINDTFKDGTIATRLSCVYLTFYSGKKLPPYYIGSCFVDQIIDKDYNGSVTSKTYGKTWKSEQKNNKHLFNTVILQYFGDRTEANAAESDFQTANDVVKSNQYTNMCIANEYGCNSASMAGRSQSSEHKKKKADKIRGMLSGHFTGYFVTPIGKFITAKDASLGYNKKCSASFIRKSCGINNNNVINIHSVCRCDILNDSHLGLTFKEAGFYKQQA